VKNWNSELLVFCGNLFFFADTFFSLTHFGHFVRNNIKFQLSDFFDRIDLNFFDHLKENAVSDRKKTA